MVVKIAALLGTIPLTIAADTAIDPGITGYFAQLGVGAILAAPAYWFWFRAEKAKEELVDKLLESEKAATQRERDLATEMVPVIRDGALALREVKEAMGALVTEARDVQEANRRDQQTRRLELAIDKLGKAMGEE